MIFNLNFSDLNHNSPILNVDKTCMVSSAHSFSFGILIEFAGPENPTILMKRSEWERFRVDYAAFSALSPPPSEELRKVG